MRKQRTERIDKVSIARATGQAKALANEMLTKVKAFEEDAEKDVRFNEQLCKSCFYFRRTRLAGQVFTDRDCGICSTTMTFSSTATNPICKPCAHTNGLCQQCGGDIEMKTRRTPYPFMGADNE